MTSGFALHEIITNGSGEPIDYRFLEVNPAFEKLTGLRRDDVVGRTVLEVLPGIESVWIERYGEVALTGEPAEFEEYSGELDRHYVVRAYCPRKGQFAVIFSDVTERRRTEDATRRAKNEWERTFDTVPDLISILDTEFRVTRVNRAMADALGVEPAQAVGLTCYEAVHGTDEPPDYCPHRQLLEDGCPHTVEANVERLGGWFAVSTSPLRDAQGRVTGSVHVAHDVTERKRAGEALRDSEARYRALAENSAVGVWHVAPDGHTVYINPAMCKMLEIESPEEIEGQTYHEFFTPESLEIMQDEHVKRPQGIASAYEVVLVGRRGTQRDILLCGAPLFSAGEQLMGLIGTFVDITERRQLEARIQQAQKMESLGMLAGGIAHDFNNLLMVILGNAELAQHSISPASPACDNLEEIDKATRRAAGLCEQMLAYAGKGRFVVEALGLREVVEEMAHLLEVSVSDHAALRFHFAEDTRTVEADVAQLRQIVTNLVMNASEAIGKSNGVISISTGSMVCDRAYLEDTWIEEERPEGVYSFVEVTDTGCGMDAETQERIFDPFFTTKFTGRGLGMAAVLGIVRSHQGTIRIYSEEGKGTTVKVLLPACEQDVADAGRTADDQREEWQGEGTILVVDDEETVRAVAMRMVEVFGFQALVAEHGRHALDVYREHRDEIACVLLDLTMPHMDGKEAFRELRRIDPDVRVILASGYGEQEIRQRFAGRQVNGFIQKPYSFERLRAELMAVFQAE